MMIIAFGFNSGSFPFPANMVQYNMHFSSSQAIQSQPACAGVLLLDH